jgi:predicted Zn-dependent protease with MMP-like domain
MAAVDVEDQIEQHLERGYAALERGDLGAARKAAQSALGLDAAVAEAHTLLGSVAEREGDVEAAQRAYRTARKVDATAFEPILALAEIAHAQGEIGTARKLFGEATEHAEEEEEYIEALLAHAEFELAEGDGQAAHAVLRELPPVDLPEPNDHLRAGDALRQVSALDGAEPAAALTEAVRHFERAEAQAGDDPTLRADALYGLGLVAEARGQQAEMARRFAEVLAIDAQEARPAWTLSDERMEALVEEVLGELPERARELLANVPIIIEGRPSRAQVQDGLDPRLLGLFSGPSLPETGDAPALQQITLYARNLERAAADVDDLEEEIRVTLLHETGHFFGLDEDALKERGLD